MKSRILASLFLVVYFVSESYGRDLLIEVKSGKVQKKDTFSTDAYMSVTVCKEKQRTPTVKSNLNPVWNWAHTFRNVVDTCRLKFHLYDDDFGSDDTIGEMETTVGNFLRERAEESTLVFGKKGDSQIKVRVKYTDTFGGGSGRPSPTNPGPPYPAINPGPVSPSNPTRPPWRF